MYENYISFSILAPAGLIILMSFTQSANGDNLNPGVYAIDSRPFGISYGEWTFRFWQWITMIPNDKNPNTDTTGVNCAIGQQGPVWFLAPSFGGVYERTCNVPGDRAILFPILTGECDYMSNPSVKTPEELIRCASEGNEGIMFAEVDGMEIIGLEKYRVQSPFLNMVIPEDNAFGAPPGTSIAVTVGYWVFLEPLSLGSHEIHFKGSVLANPTIGIESYSSDVIYHINVLPS